MKPTARREKFLTNDCLWLFALACLVRFTASAFSPFILEGDAKEYMALAKNISNGGTFAFLVDGLYVPTANRAPAYPFLVSLAGGDIVSVVIVQCILGSVTVVLTYLLALKFLNHRHAVISAVLLSLAPTTVYFTSKVMTETLFAFLVVLGVYLLVSHSFKVAGLVFGVGLLVRPTVLPFLLFLIALSFVWPVLLKRKQLVLMSAVALAVAVPWSVRNSLLMDRPVFTQATGYGINLLFGGIEVPLFGDDVWTYVLSLPVTQPVPGLNEAELDAYRMKLALSRIAEDPAGWLRARAKQYPRLFFDSGDYILGPYNEMLSVAPWPVVVFKFAFVLSNLLFFALALVGGWAMRNAPHLIAYPAFLALCHIPMWIETRYFLSAVPFCCILAVAGVRFLWAKLRTSPPDKRPPPPARRW